MNIEKILDDHKEWILDNTKGRRADLSMANLYGANLSGANLRGTNLKGTNLKGTYLRRAHLYGANLSGANLSGADLREADLRGTNLKGTYLCRAHLYGANLSGADLSGADLSGADLSYTEVFTFTLGQHFGFAHFGSQYADGSYVQIGCEGHNLDYWLDNFESIGNKHNYTKAQIANYGRMLKMLDLVKLEDNK
jgi:uncharacterized protein YjbI with pentapeptide repeats